MIYEMTSLKSSLGKNKRVFASKIYKYVCLFFSVVRFVPWVVCCGTSGHGTVFGPGTVGPGTVGPGTVGPGTVGPGTVGHGEVDCGMVRCNQKIQLRLQKGFSSIVI